MGTWPGTRAPRGADEIAAVLAGRPPGWEYLYFAGNLLAGRDAVEERFETPVAGSAPPIGEPVADSAAVDYLRRAIAEIQGVVASLTPLFAPDVLAAAFGPPGQAGDPVRIRQLADRWNAVYELMLDWRQRLRAADPSDTYRALFGLAAQLVDRPVREYHDFVDAFIAQVDRIPAALAAGAPLDITMALSLDVDDAVLTAYTAELDALAARLPALEPRPPDPSAVAVASSRPPVPWGWYAFYLVLLVAGVGGSLVAGYQGDLFWLTIGWGIALGVITRILGLRPPR